MLKWLKKLINPEKPEKPEKPVEAEESICFKSEAVFLRDIVLARNNQLSECYFIILLLEGEKGLDVIRFMETQLEVPQSNIDQAFRARAEKAGYGYKNQWSYYTGHITGDGHV